jgi:hypothetical protein
VEFEAELIAIGSGSRSVIRAARTSHEVTLGQPFR